MSKKLKKAIFIPDCHVPYHDKKSFALLLRVIKKVQPDIVVILGDFADFYAVSFHEKDPKRKNDIQWEADEVKRHLRMVREAAGEDCRIVYVMGNHEHRLQRYLFSNASALAGLRALQLRELFGLDELRMESVEYKDHIKIGKLHITHDAGKAGKNAHQDALSAFQSNIIIGHTHRLGYCVEGSATGKPHVGAMFGWLGDVTTIDYVHKIRALRDWATGFGMGYLEPSGLFHIMPVPIVCGTAVVEGQLVT